MTGKNVVITGSSGLVGSELVSYLRSGSYNVSRLVRREANNNDEITWKPTENVIEKKKLSGVDVAVHLAGESIAPSSLLEVPFQRWTEKKKEKIRKSRAEGTRFLARTLSELPDPPELLICASAVGYYGDRGDTICTEDTSSGDLFLSNVCEDWESAADPARNEGIRVIHARLGMVLSSRGGALKQMLPIFKLGAGGRIGSGEQWMSWISLRDVVRFMEFSFNKETLSGPVNVVSPFPVRNRKFTMILGNVIGAPSVFPLPSPVAKFIFGQLAEELFLSSTRVKPQKLVEHGFSFQYSHLDSALLYHLNNESHQPQVEMVESGSVV